MRYIRFIQLFTNRERADLDDPAFFMMDQLMYTFYIFNAFDVVMRLATEAFDNAQILVYFIEKGLSNIV